jgi:hypothetical protein
LGLKEAQLKHFSFFGISGGHAGAHHGDLCKNSGHLTSGSSTQPGFVSRLHADVDLHLKQFRFTDISGLQTIANIGDLRDDFGRITSSDSNISQMGFISFIHDEYHRARANYGDFCTMANVKLACVYSTMIIDVMRQLHEIGSTDDGNT